MMRHPVAAMLLLAGYASAQGLPDPTRPPPEMVAPAPGIAAPVAAAVPRLQSILIGRPPNERRVAVIDGVTVRVGARIGGAVVVSIKEKEVVLRQGTETLTLTLSDDAAPAPAKTGTP